MDKSIKLIEFMTIWFADPIYRDINGILLTFKYKILTIMMFQVKRTTSFVLSDELLLSLKKVLVIILEKLPID